MVAGLRTEVEKAGRATGDMRERASANNALVGGIDNYGEEGEC